MEFDLLMHVPFSLDWREKEIRRIGYKNVTEAILKKLFAIAYSGV